MPDPMTYSEAVAFLGQSRLFGMKPGLERMRRIAQRLGSLQKRLRFLHLAGTNGKGSTAALAESCLRAHGLRVGLYTSPHLVSVRERIQIDREPISTDDFAAGIEAVREALGDGEDRDATFFELITGLALWYFARAGIDCVVWETGLGGRFDATNIVTPEVCVITRIALDHQRYLGTTLREIAGEKAGIIKPHVPVISAEQAADAAEVLTDTARVQEAPLHFASDVADHGLRNGRQQARLGGMTCTLGLIGAHQVLNAACAAAAVRQLLPVVGWPVDEAALARGLEETSWPGRFQVISREPLVVLDGAHNPDGVAQLVQTWQSFLSAHAGPGEDARAHLVFGAVDDKAIGEMVERLRPLAHHVSLVRLASERSVDPAKVAPLFSPLPCRIFSSVAEFYAAFSADVSHDPVLIAGSLYLVGEFLAHRKGRVDDLQLNERLETSRIVR